MSSDGLNPQSVFVDEPQAWPEVVINDWPSLLQEMYQVKNSFRDADWIYRGQSQADWSLTPSIYRGLKPECRESETIQRIEWEGRDIFLRRIHLFPDNDTSVSGFHRDGLDVLTLMQQHGCETRLLDWTKLAFVAVYFAVEKDFDKAGAVWVASASQIVVRVRGKWNTDHARDPTRSINNAIEVASPYQPTPRMIAQHGLFTNCGDHGIDHDVVISSLRYRSESAKSNWMKKLVIPAARKIEFLEHLRDWNIHGLALFPGLDGLGRLAKELQITEAFKRGAIVRASS